MSKSFREYFIRKIKKENLSRFFGFRIDEMAKEQQRVRKSVQFDKDDIEFLYQFPHNLWSQAMNKRYDLLFDEIEKLHKIKDVRQFRDLIKAIENYLKDRTRENAEVLKDIEEPFGMRDDEIETLSNSNPIQGIRELSAYELSVLAEKIANDHFDSNKESLVDVINDPKSVTFTFKNVEYVAGSDRKKGGHRSKDTIDIKANPYLLRLYHKLEKTEGEKHNFPEFSGQVGKYGIELRDPVRNLTGSGPHLTRNTQFPTRKNIRISIKRFMELNGHRMFGNFDPTDSTIRWMNSGYKDTRTRAFAVKEYKDNAKVNLYLRRALELAPDVDLSEEEVTSAFQNANALSVVRIFNNLFGKDPLHSARDVTSDAIETEAIRNLVDDVRSGRLDLRGPPSPSHPDGIPVKIRRITVKGVTREDIDNPPLFLPFKKKIVNVNGVDQEKWIPLVNPAHFYRKLKDGESAPEEMLRGHDKKFVKSDVYDPSGKSVYSDGGIFFNRNTPAQRRLIKGRQEYTDAYQKIIENQRLVGYSIEKGKAVINDDSSHNMREDILRGVLRCVNSPDCGGKTDHEIAIMLRHIPLIYKFCFNLILNNLDNKLLENPNNIEKESFKNASLLSQKNWDQGAGTRRTRAFTDETRAARQQQPLRQTRTQNTGTNTHFPYNTDNLLAFTDRLNQIENNAIEATRKKQQANMRRSETELTKGEISNLFGDLIRSESMVYEDLIMMLATIIRTKNRKEKEARENAESIVRNWLDQNLSMTEMVSAFKNLEIVKDFMNASKVATPEATPISKRPNLIIQNKIDAALAELDKDAGPEGNMKNPKIMGKFTSRSTGEYSPYVSTIKSDLETDPVFSNDPENLTIVLNQVQDALNKKIGISATGAAPTAPPTAPVTGTSSSPDKIEIIPNADWRSLFSDVNPKNYYNIVFSNNFKTGATNNIILNVKSRIQKMRPEFNEEQYKKMMDEISKIQEERRKEE
jgi:hypothetical protein